MNFWQQLVLMIVTPSLGVAAVAWLIREWFRLGVTRDLETFKHNLELARFEHQTRFSLIHQKRAEALVGIYARLVRAKSLLGDLVALFQPGGQSLNEKKRRTAEACNEASAYFFENRIFVSPATAAKVEAVLDAMRDAFVTFDSAQMGNDEYKPDLSGMWSEAFKTVRDTIPPLLAELEAQFQLTLGVIENAP